MKRKNFNDIGTIIGIGNSLKTTQNFLFFIKNNVDIMIYLLLPRSLLLK